MFLGINNFENIIGLESGESKKFCNNQIDKNPVSIMGTDIVSKTQNTKSELMDQLNSTTMYNDMQSAGQVASVLKEIGCIPLVAVAESAVDKIKSIVDGVRYSLESLSAELAGLYGKELTEDELAEKIELIKAKQQAIIEEGEAKTKAISTIAGVLNDLCTSVMDLLSIGCKDFTFLDVLSELLNSISSSPSSLSNINDINDIEGTLKENKKNIFGQQSEKKLESSIQSLDRKIQDNEAKINNKNCSHAEKEKLRLEIHAYKIQKKAFSNLGNKLLKSV